MTGNPLTKMVGPYPLGVWLGVIAGGLGIAYVLQRGDRAASTQADAEAASVLPVPTPGGPVGYYDGARPESDTGLTNPEWARTTAPRLAALTGRNPTAVQAALIRYINGEETDCSIVNAALAAGWWPPELVPAPICDGSSPWLPAGPAVDVFGTPITGPHRRDLPGTPTGTGTGYIHGQFLTVTGRPSIKTPALDLSPVSNYGGPTVGAPTT